MSFYSSGGRVSSPAAVFYVLPIIAAGPFSFQNSVAAFEMAGASDFRLDQLDVNRVHVANLFHEGSAGKAKRL